MLYTTALNALLLLASSVTQVAHTKIIYAGINEVKSLFSFILSIAHHPYRSLEENLVYLLQSTHPDSGCLVALVSIMRSLTKYFVPPPLGLTLIHFKIEYGRHLCRQRENQLFPRYFPYGTHVPFGVWAWPTIQRNSM